MIDTWVIVVVFVSVFLFAFTLAGGLPGLFDVIQHQIEKWRGKRN